MILNMTSYTTFLTEELARRKRTNPLYSQRAFAQQLGLSPGELSEILSEKRALSFKSAIRIAKALGLNSTETKHLLHLSQIKRPGTAGNEDLVRSLLQVEGRQISLDIFNIVSDWYCFAILNLTETKGFNWNLGWIAKRLKISTAEVKAALDRLERAGLVENKDGVRVVTPDYIMASSAMPSEAIRNYHRQILRKAIDSLDFQRIEEREISGITMAVDKKNLPAIKKDISDFQDQIIAKYSRGEKTEVYHLENVFFKLSEGDSDENKKK